MRVLLSAPLAAILLCGNAAPADRWAGKPHGPVYIDDVAPMNRTVQTRLMPQVDALLEQLLREKRAMRLAGVEVFKSGDKFLPGKIAYAMAQRALALGDDDPRLPDRLAEFADIAELTLGDPNESWGIYYYIAALHDLDQRGLLTRAVRPAALAKLRAQLDWRRFVRPDLTLIDLPNNYYGVAFSIARLRHLLGWEDDRAAQLLLARTLDHYRKYSGEFGFADETEGKGRFDRYSVLLIGEIAQRLVETGMTPSPEVKAWLRKSVDLLLPRFNLSGEGFEYGRSIGAYGETAFLEVLTAAALLKVLTPEEERMAYAFSSRIAARYMDFWVNPQTGSVDLWGQGRRTDAYRGIHRIFGENLSLARQYVYTNAIWNRLGYRGRAPDRRYAQWLRNLPRSTTTWFARGDYDRALVTVRHHGKLIGLPIINGAEGQHMHNPYFPVPFSPGMLSGSADATYPHLVPRITLADGSVLMPLAYFKDLRVTRRGNVTEVSWRQDALDRMGENEARPDRRAQIETRYVLAPGRITRSDRLLLEPGARATGIEIEFASFSSGPKSRAGVTRFGRGEIRSFAAKGYGTCVAKTPDAPDYGAPTGPFAAVVRCRNGDIGRPSSISLEWTLSYD
ncbi:hypothetical protein FPZ54_03280 [Sphingomonas suaedae]|uniref:DUF2264 domain-containing protein n=1 Tax=Sphingomonas suaedae TaxID=2599297 RepID=A0A518RCN0_9SPHN|nr:hypothetical protein [Sphingomonas suaedae]QDX25141.1 hypothetical protein FPZ54_03280 [Sphingomonas suaedae]